MSLFSTVCFCEMLLVFQELPKMIKFKEIGVILEYMQNLHFRRPILPSCNLRSSYPYM